ncbi:MAG: hypothetical protein KAT31_12525 [Bacteroidales bacterium]|nr:hypothetical protein [Bacteroidales bacterium]
MAKKKKTILPIILMVDDKSPTGMDNFVLALRQLGKDDIPDKADKKAVFEAGLLINPVDYLPGFQRRKGQTLTTGALADEVKGLRDQLKQYEIFLRKQKDKEVDVYTLLEYISTK